MPVKLWRARRLPSVTCLACAEGRASGSGQERLFAELRSCHSRLLRLQGDFQRRFDKSTNGSTLLSTGQRRRDTPTAALADKQNHANKPQVQNGFSACYGQPEKSAKIKFALPAWAGVLPEPAIPPVWPPDCAGRRESCRPRLAESRLATVG